MILFFSLFLTFSLSLTNLLYFFLAFISLPFPFFLSPLLHLYFYFSLSDSQSPCLALPCLLLYSGSTDRSSTKSFHLSKTARKKPVSGTPTVHSICSLPTHFTFLLFSTFSSLFTSLYFSSLSSVFYCLSPNYLLPLHHFIFYPLSFVLQSFVFLYFTILPSIY